ncbi:MAG: TonB family protein [Paludibacter sp.]|nr:TonB family protein [Paludibacter sp.]
MKKSELYAYIGTAISGIIILLILFFVMLPGLKNTEDGGIMISFGDAFDGGGAVEAPSQSAKQSSPPKAEVKEELLTQKDKSVAIPETKKKPDTRPSQTDDRLKKEQQASQQAEDLIGGSFGSNNNTGSGQTTGQETAGNPVGSGTSGGNSWSLSGRNLLGTMPTPSYNKNIEGSLTVAIRVDAAGNVIDASISRGNISDATLRQEAIRAARRTKFSSGKDISTGTITYIFKLK